jgi:hypothetical protein
MATELAQCGKGIHAPRKSVSHSDALRERLFYDRTSHIRHRGSAALVWERDATAEIGLPCPKHLTPGVFTSLPLVPDSRFALSHGVLDR